MTILDDASKAVVARGESYGTPADNHGRTAAMWSAYLGVKVTAFDVCMLNIMQKVSRARCDPGHRDNLVDVAGYAENAERCAVKDAPERCTVKDAPEKAPADIGMEFYRCCMRCGLKLPARKAVVTDAAQRRFVAVVWRCGCGWAERQDIDTIARHYPRVLLVPGDNPPPV